MKLLFVFNPHSGKELIKPQLADILDIFTKAGYDVTVRPTQKPLDAYDYIRAHAEEYDRIVVSGGDGTLSEATGALMTIDADKRAELGYIPSGTTNDFASTLNIPNDMTEAADITVSGSPFRCDVGSFNGKIFNYVAAFGAFTDVSYDTPQGEKNVMGHAAYVWEGIKRLPTLQSYRAKIKYDGGEIDDDIFLCIIMNTTSVGGILSTEHLMNVDLNDGLFEMIIFRQPTNPFELQNVIAGIVRGDTEGEHYTVTRSSRFEIISEEKIKWTLDGEFGGETENAVIEVLQSAITYIVKN